jgi:hypothetical protein
MTSVERLKRKMREQEREMLENLSLRLSSGKYTKIVLVIDNTPWHNRLTNDTMLPKQSWRKECIIQWLNNRNIDVTVKAVKDELLDIAMKNLPEKRYETDEAVKK